MSRHTRTDLAMQTRKIGTKLGLGGESYGKGPRGSRSSLGKFRCLLMERSFCIQHVSRDTSVSFIPSAKSWNPGGSLSDPRGPSFTILSSCLLIACRGLTSLSQQAELLYLLPLSEGRASSSRVLPQQLFLKPHQPFHQSSLSLTGLDTTARCVSSFSRQDATSLMEGKSKLHGFELVPDMVIQLHSVRH